MPIHSTSSELSAASLLARTAAGTSSWLNVSRYEQVHFYVEVTVVAGTSPVLTLWIEDSPDATTAFPITAEYAMTAATTLRIPIAVSATYLRIRWEISGTTPSFTFQVTYIGKT